MGRMGICFTSVATSWRGEACCLLLCFPTGTSYCVALSAVLNFDYLGECSHWGNRGRVALPTSDENLRYITPGTSLINEAPPMPLRASSHPGSPNSPSCSALAWYSCWPGLSPWGESGYWTPLARTIALTCYHYTTQPTWSRQFHRTSNGINPSSSFRDMSSPKSGPSAAWFDKFSAHGQAHLGQMTMTLHNYRYRQVHETLNGVNPYSSFRDMHSAKSGPNLWQIWQVFGPWARPDGANG